MYVNWFNQILHINQWINKWSTMTHKKSRVIQQGPQHCSGFLIIKGRWCANFTWQQEGLLQVTSSHGGLKKIGQCLYDVFVGLQLFNSWMSLLEACKIFISTPKGWIFHTSKRELFDPMSKGTSLADIGDILLFMVQKSSHELRTLEKHLYIIWCRVWTLPP